MTLDDCIEIERRLLRASQLIQACRNAFEEEDAEFPQAKFQGTVQRHVEEVLNLVRPDDHDEEDDQDDHHVYEDDAAKRAAQICRPHQNGLPGLWFGRDVISLNHSTSFAKQVVVAMQDTVATVIREAHNRGLLEGLVSAQDVVKTFPERAAQMIQNMIGVDP